VLPLFYDVLTDAYPVCKTKQDRGVPLCIRSHLRPQQNLIPHHLFILFYSTSISFSITFKNSSIIFFVTIPPSAHSDGYSTYPVFSHTASSAMRRRFCVGCKTQPNPICPPWPGFGFGGHFCSGSRQQLRCFAQVCRSGVCHICPNWTVFS